MNAQRYPFTIQRSTTIITVSCSSCSSLSRPEPTHSIPTYRSRYTTCAGGITFHGYDFGFDHEVGVGYHMFGDAVLRRQGHHPDLFLADDGHELPVARHLRLLLELRDARTADAAAAAGVAGHALRAPRQRRRHPVQPARVFGRRFCNTTELLRLHRYVIIILPSPSCRIAKMCINKK